MWLNIGLLKFALRSSQLRATLQLLDYKSKCKEAILSNLQLCESYIYILSTM